MTCPLPPVLLRNEAHATVPYEAYLGCQTILIQVPELDVDSFSSALVNCSDSSKGRTGAFAEVEFSEMGAGSAVNR